MTLRDEFVERERRIKIMRNVLSAMADDRKFLTTLPYSDQLSRTYREIRTSLRSSRDVRILRKTDFREKRKNYARDKIVEILRHHYNDPALSLEHGIPVTAIKERKYNRAVYNIKVGWMWLERVYEPLYRDVNTKYYEWLILSAKKKRINIKHVELYEVKAFGIKSGDIADGYVGITKGTNKKEAFFKTKGIDAANAAYRAVSEQINQTLRGTEE